jgi:hypothetical protein
LRRSKQAIFDINIKGAPTPNGLGTLYFDKYGDIVRTNVFNAISHFFKIDRLLPNYNSNNVLLIPKSLQATNMEHCRPITLAKFKFNIFTQFLAYNGLAYIMPKSIYTHQRGFNIRKQCSTNRVLTRWVYRVYIFRYQNRVNLEVNSIFD